MLHGAVHRRLASAAGHRRQEHHRIAVRSGVRQSPNSSLTATRRNSGASVRPRRAPQFLVQLARVARRVSSSSAAAAGLLAQQREVAHVQVRRGRRRRRTARQPSAARVTVGGGYSSRVLTLSSARALARSSSSTSRCDSNARGHRCPARSTASSGARLRGLVDRAQRLGHGRRSCCDRRSPAASARAARSGARSVARSRNGRSHASTSQARSGVGSAVPPGCRRSARDPA